VDTFSAQVTTGSRRLGKEDVPAEEEEELDEEE
jgi:hypothetical protein